MDAQLLIICGVIVAGVLYIAYNYKPKAKVYLTPKVEKYIPSAPKQKFYVYNYYQTPITVKVSQQPIIEVDKFVGDRIENSKKQNVDVSIYAKKSKASIDEIPYITLVENIEPGKFKAVSIDLWKNIVDNKRILIENAADKNPSKEPIGESVMTIPNGKTIKALHCGMNSGQSDIAISADITKSPLGTALPRLRIVNVTPRTVNLTTTGGNILTIPGGKSLLYFGEYENGIPMGVTFRDIDGILPEYNLKIPLTDLFLGVISDIGLPLYRGSKIGNSFFDDPGQLYHPFEELDSYQLHRGAFIDKSYIPKNW